MKVLIVRLSSMGDVVLAAAVLPYLSERYPGCVVEIVTQRPYSELFAGDPRVQCVHIYDRASRHLEQPTGRNSWDLVIDLQNNARSRALLRKIAPGVPQRRFCKAHGRRFLLLALRINTYHRTENVVFRYLRTAGRGDGAVDRYAPTLAAPFTVPAEDWPELAGGRPALALLPFAAWRNKTWPIECYAAVAGHFIRAGWSVGVFGGPEDRSEAERLCSALGAQAWCAAGRATLAQTAALLGRCRVALGGDTGLSHLARARGVPTAIIYGATTWHFGFFPFGPPPFRILETPLLCRPCHPHGGHLCWRGGRPCLARVSAASVIEALEELVATAGGTERTAEIGRQDGGGTRV